MQETMVDFLGRKFEIYKCSRCRKQFTRNQWDKVSSFTCPTCTNKKENEDDNSN